VGGLAAQKTQKDWTIDKIIDV